MNGRAGERTLRPGLDAFSSAGRLFGGGAMDRRVLGQGLLRAVASALLAALTVLAALLVERRLAGALAQPLSPGLLIAAGILLAGCAAVIRWVLFSRPDQASLSTVRLPLVFLPTALLFFAGISLSLPASGYWSLGCFWLLLIGEEVGTLRPWWRSRKGLGGASQSPPAEPPLARATALAEPLRCDLLDAEQAESDDELAEVPPPEDVTQQMVRRRQADGTQALTGSLRVDFAAGERTATAHLAFCPPFDRTPEFSAAAMAGPGAQVRAVQVLAYGVRLEIKLDSVSRAAESVLVGFEATQRGTRSAERGTEEGELGP